MNGRYGLHKTQWILLFMRNLIEIRDYHQYIFIIVRIPLTLTHTHPTPTRSFSIPLSETFPDRLVWASHWKLWILEEFYSHSVDCNWTGNSPDRFRTNKPHCFGRSFPHLSCHSASSRHICQNIQLQSSKTSGWWSETIIIKMNSIGNFIWSFWPRKMPENVNCACGFLCHLLHLYVAYGTQAKCFLL